MKIRCKHILLSYDDAENTSHDRPLSVAVADAEKLIVEIKKGDITFSDAAAKHSSCMSGRRTEGDLGWAEEEKYHPDFSNAVKCILLHEIGPPIISPWGVHIVLRTG